MCETISHQMAHHALSVGWDTHLSAAIKEREDMQQEHDSEMHRACLSCLAGPRFTVLKDKMSNIVQFLLIPIIDWALHE
jgi:hypothetical protein